MAVVGFNITKLDAELKAMPKGKYSITPKFNLSKVEVEDFPMSKDGSQKVIRTSFSCGFHYEGGSKVVTEGFLLYLVPTKIADEAESTYKDSKSLPPIVAQRIMGTIFTRCQTTSIVIAKEVGLPSPVPLPKLSVKAKETTEEKPKK